MDTFPHITCIVSLALSIASASSIYPGLCFLLLIFTSFSLIIYHTLLSRTLTSIYHPVYLPTSFPLSQPLLILSVALSLSCCLEVIGIFSQGRPCLRSGVLMPGWLSGTDSSVPVGDHQTFSDSDHRSPMWIGLMCILSLLLFTAVHYKQCDMARKT